MLYSPVNLILVKFPTKKPIFQINFHERTLRPKARPTTAALLQMWKQLLTAASVGPGWPSSTTQLILTISFLPTWFINNINTSQTMAQHTTHGPLAITHQDMGRADHYYLVITDRFRKYFKPMEMINVWVVFVKKKIMFSCLCHGLLLFCSMI